VAPSGEQGLPPPIPPDGGPPPRSLVKAVGSAAVLLAAVALAYALGAPAMLLLVVGVVLASLLELLGALRARGGRVVVPFALAATAALVVAAYRGSAFLLLGALAALTLGALVLALRPARGPTPVSDAAWTVLSVTWIGGGGAAAAAILGLGEGGSGLLVAYLLTAACDDIAAYFVGVRWGRHKLAPAISPAKSWEGAVGGFGAAVVAGSLAGGALDELSWLEGIGIGVVCGALAPVGDLVESLAKREIGIKDSGGLLPGHGGFLDRVDAMILCAPGVLVYLKMLGL